MAYRNYKLLGKKEYITSEEAFQFYRKRAKHRDKPTNYEKKHFAKILNAIYGKISDAVVEYEGGVYCPNYFYIVPQPFPNKLLVDIVDSKGNHRSTMNVHTEGLLFSIIFVNLLSAKKHRIWDMTNSYFSGIRQKLTKTLKEYNPSYLFSLDTLRKVK
ncbi:MAG: hypothetical protein KDH96_04530 [Candidatus Riesia sp.]|nr:hypothetical protein [Candidatus Riesia sp.]